MHRGLTASFAYDALGRRIQKTINGRTIQYLYDGKDIVLELESGLPAVRYIRTLNIDEPLARIELATNKVRYYYTDALGSIIGLSDESGQQVTRYAYDAFGQVAISGEMSDNPFQYTGRENDGTGLYYYRARYYSPELQRFVSEDPILKLGHPNVPFLLPRILKNPAMLAAYNYVKNNPLLYTDPIGLMSCTDLCNLACSTGGTLICGFVCLPATGPGAPICWLGCGTYAWFACTEQCTEICKDPPKCGSGGNK